MKLKKLLSGLLVSIVLVGAYTNSVSAETIVNWEKIYDNADYQMVVDAIKTNDGGAITVGATNSIATTSASKIDAYITKLDSTGEIEWSKNYGNQYAMDQLTSIAQTNDGGYIASGTSGFTGWIIKIDADGNIIWNKSVSGTFTFVKIIAKSDGGYLGLAAYTGTTAKPTNGGTDAAIYNIDENGNVIWMKSYGGNLEDVFTNAIESEDNGFILVGKSGSNYADYTNKGALDAFVIKIDKDGNIIWKRLYGSKLNDEISDIYYDSIAGEYLLTGSYNDVSAVFIKMKEDGTTNLVKVYDAPEDRFIEFETAQRTADNGYIIGGKVVLKDNAGSRIVAVKFDENGEFVWENRYGRNQRTNTLVSMLVNDQNNYVAFAYTSGDNNTYYMYGVTFNEQYKLTFDTNNGSDTKTSSQTLIVGIKADNVEKPTRTSYNFVGWNTKKDGSGLFWDFDTNTMPGKNLVLYATWQEKNTNQEIVEEKPNITKPIETEYDYSLGQEVSGENRMLLPTEESTTSNNMTLPTTGLNNINLMVSAIFSIMSIGLIGMYIKIQDR